MGVFQLETSFYDALFRTIAFLIWIFWLFCVHLDCSLSLSFFFFCIWLVAGLFSDTMNSHANARQHIRILFMKGIRMQSIYKWQNKSVEECFYSPGRFFSVLFILISNKYKLVCHSGELHAMLIQKLCSAFVCYVVYRLRALCIRNVIKTNNRKFPYISYLNLTSAFLIYHYAMNFDDHVSCKQGAQLQCIVQSDAALLYFLSLLEAKNLLLFWRVCVLNMNWIKQWLRSN